MHNESRYKIFCVTNSSNGLKELLFEDVVESEYGYWARVCNRHSLEASVKNVGLMEDPYTCSGGALCDIFGCEEQADFYIDFKKESIVRETECAL